MPSISSSLRKPSLRKPMRVVVTTSTSALLRNQSRSAMVHLARVTARL